MRDELGKRERDEERPRLTIEHVAGPVEVRLDRVAEPRRLVAPPWPRDDEHGDHHRQRERDSLAPPEEERDQDGRRSRPAPTGGRAPCTRVRHRPRFRCRSPSRSASAHHERTPISESSAKRGRDGRRDRSGRARVAAPSRPRRASGRNRGRPGLAGEQRRITTSPAVSAGSAAPWPTRVARGRR